MLRLLVEPIVRAALAEDLGRAGDITTDAIVPADAEVTVRSQVKQSGAEPITIDYAMEKTASGWKIFDVSIGGISLAANYRTAFGEEVRNHGVEGLITLLADKNRQAAAKPRRAATLAGSS